MVYLYSVENVITLGKLIGLLFLFCPPLPLYFVFENSKNTRNELARPVMGTIFLIIIIFIIINFFRWVFSEYTEVNATSLIPLDTIHPEICAFINGFSCTVWTKIRSLAGSLADGVLADGILIPPRPPISGR